jgi:hypothetical protein
MRPKDVRKAGAAGYVMSDAKDPRTRSRLVRAELRRLYADSRKLREDSCRVKGR